MTGLLTIPQAAERLGVSTRIAQREVRRAEQTTGVPALMGIPVEVLNGRRRVSAAAVDALLTKQAS